jgi:hypothetical protein
MAMAGLATHAKPKNEIMDELSFVMSRSDSEFLVSYIWWRMSNPIAR